MVHLQPVDRTNWADCGKLSLLPEQQANVASNLHTIAESKFETHYTLRAIYHGKTVVGMLAYCPEDEPYDPALYWIFRLLIDREHHRRGYAYAAMQLAVAEIWSLGANRILTMHKPANTTAAALYAKLGFSSTGKRLDDGDLLLEMLRQPE